MKKLITKGILTIRLVLAGILVGFPRPIFDPVCLARTSPVYLVAVIVLIDFGIVLLAALNALRLGRGGPDIEDSHEQRLPLLFLAISHGFWTCGSIVMLLGVSLVAWSIRIILPAIGALALVYLTTVFSERLVTASGRVVLLTSTTPEDSPYRPSERETDRASMRGPLVCNPTFGAAYRSDSPSNANEVTPWVNQLSPPRVFTGQSSKRNDFNERSQSRQSQTSGVRGTTPELLQSFVSTSVALKDTHAGRGTGQLRPFFSRSVFSSSTRSKGARPIISNPIPIMDPAPDKPFARMATVDLVTAAAQFRARNHKRTESGTSINHPTLKDTASPSLEITRAEILPIVMPESLNAMSTSRSLAPSNSITRQRSPRSQAHFKMVLEEKTPSRLEVSRPGFEYRPPVPLKSGIGLPTNPRSKINAIKQQYETVLFLNEIVYNDPVTVQNIQEKSTRHTDPTKKDATIQSDSLADNKLVTHGSIIHRPRPSLKKFAEQTSSTSLESSSDISLGPTIATEDSPQQVNRSS